MANPWEQNADPINSPAGTGQGASAPIPASADNNPSVPWHQEHAPINNPAGNRDEGSVWESIKANLGARVDAAAASMLQDEGTDRSRYAMKRAERSNQEARVQESKLSGMQKIGVGAADIGVGLGLGAVNPALAAGYFTAQGTADQLRQQAEETGRYDLQKAAETGIAQAAAAEGAGQIAGKVVGRIMPNLANRAVGQTLTATGGGAGGGASMQMISNLANGKDINEGVGEAALMGAAGGLGAHAATPIARSIARAPTTLRNIQGAGAAEAARRNPVADLARSAGEEYRAQQQGEQAPQEPAVQAGEGSIPVEGAVPPEAGAIPVSEPKATPQPGVVENESGLFVTGTDGQLYPGTRTVGGKVVPVDPNAPFNYEVGDGSSGPAGLGFGPGAPSPAPRQEYPEGIRQLPKEAAHTATKLWRAFQKEGIAGALSPKGVKQMADTELTAEKQGLKPGNALTEQAKATEGSMDILQQQLENTPVDTPEFKNHVNAITELAMKSGSAAAHTRANALAVDVGMPITSKFHDVTLTRGLKDESNPVNVAQDVHGLSPTEITKEHRAVLESKATNLPGLGEIAEQQRQKYQTYESHHNATREAYLKAQQKVENAFNGNYELAVKTREQLRSAEQPELYESAQRLTENLRDYNSMATEVANGKPINTERLEMKAREITRDSTALGLSDKFKGINGETGVFNPAIDLQAWHNFNTRTRGMHPTAPKGQFKDMVAAKEIGIEGFDVTKPATWTKPIKAVVSGATSSMKATQSMARGAAMARGAKAPTRSTSPEGEMVASEEHIQNALRRNDPTNATRESEAALKESGIATGDVTLADSPAQEVQAAQPTVAEQSAAEASTRAHVDTLLQGSQRMVEAQNAEAAAARAARPTAPEEGIPAPAPEEATPVETPPAEVPPEAPEQPVTPYEGINRPSTLPEQQTAPEAAQTPTGQGVPQRPEQRLGEQPVPEEQAPAAAPEETAPTVPEEAQPAPTQPEPVSTEEANRRAAQMSTKPKGRAEEPAAAPSAEEAPAPRGEGVPQKPKTKPAEEAKPAEETLPKTDEPVKVEETDFKEGESTEHRNKRVADMAKKMVQEKTDEVIRTPMKRLSKEHSEAIAMKAKAEGMRKGIKDIIAHAEDVAAKEGVPSADILHAVMSQKGGIEATFKDGFGKDAIKGRVNTAVKAYKTERRIAAQNNLKEASEFIQKRLGEAKVPKSREERNENIRFNMKANDVPDEVIKEAFSRARARTNSEDVTAREVANHAKMILREKAKVAAEKLAKAKPENQPEHIEHSRKALKDHIKSLDVDSITRNKLNRVISNFTTSRTGKRGALSAEESADAIAAIHHEIEARHKEAQELIKKYPKGSEASKRAFDKAQKIEEAAKQSKQAVGALKDELEQARQTQEKAEQQAAQEAQQAKLDASHARDQEQRIDRAVKEEELKEEKVLNEIRSDLEETLKERGTDEIKQFGNVVAEDLPDSIGSSKSPEYQEWKTKLDAAAKELSNRNQKTDAAFLRHFGDVVEKGLKRREELPDRPDLVITQTDYEQLRGLYNKTRKGEELDIGEAGNVQMGNMGQKLRTLLLGDASASTRQSKIKFNSDKLNAERRKALAAEHGTGDFGEALPDIVAKPANNEGSIPTPKAEKAPEPKPQRAAKPALTEQETAIKKQEAKIKRLQNRLNNDELWIHDDDRGTKWKVAQSQLKMEKYNLEQMKKGK